MRVFSSEDVHMSVALDQIHSSKYVRNYEKNPSYHTL